jgi:type VI secretion system secreted protein Hcp
LLEKELRPRHGDKNAQEVEMKNPFIHRSTISIIMALAGVSAALPAVAGDIFLYIPGVTGPVTDPRYVGDIALLSYSQGFSRTTGTSGGAGGKTTCGDISISKLIDTTSTSFLHAAVIGFVVPTATIYFSGGATVVFQSPYSITLTNFFVTSISQGDVASSGTGLGLTENISLSAQKFQFTFRPEKPDGSLGAPVTIGYDCSTQTPF